MVKLAVNQIKKVLPYVNSLQETLRGTKLSGNKNDYFTFCVTPPSHFPIFSIFSNIRTKKLSDITRHHQISDN